MNSDIDRGREAMQFYHNQSSNFAGYGLNFDLLLDKVGGGGTKTTIFLDGLGFAIRSIGMNTVQLRSAMIKLADQGQGKIPSNQSAFFRALSDEFQNINWVSAAPSIAVGVAKDVVTGIAEGGESVIGVLKTMNVIVPILFIGGFIYIAVSKIKKAA